MQTLLKRLNIGSKYGLVWAVVTVLFIASAVAVTFLLRTVENDIEAMERRAQRSVDIIHLQVKIAEKEALAYQYLAESSPELIKDYKNKQGEFTEVMKALKPKMDTEKELTLYENIRANNQEADDLFLEAIGTVNEETVLTLLLESTKMQNLTEQLLNELVDEVKDTRLEANDHAKESASMTFWVLVGSVLASIVLSGILFVIINRIVRRPMNYVVATLEQMSTGDLTVPLVEYEAKDEIAKIAAALNQMVQQFRDLASRIHTTSDEVSSQGSMLQLASSEVNIGAQQIAASMEQMAASAEEQASGAQMIASLLEELDNQIKTANEAGDSLDEASRQVYERSTEGKVKMQQSMDDMTSIHELVSAAVEKVKYLQQHTEDIGDLVEVIKGISEQTNLLALNAAIEASRAGDAGRGFAVVAEEVRKLSEEVSKSVGNITERINGIQSETKNVVDSLQDGFEKVEAGTKQMHVSQESFGEISEAMEQMLHRIQHISESLASMTDQSDKVRQSGEDIAAASEESAAGAEESAATAEQQSASIQEMASSIETLNGSAQRMNESMEAFKVDHQKTTHKTYEEMDVSELTEEQESATKDEAQV
ncbi:HAMP domain-containing protein [Bacillaceae bacterium SIJ1]|uniref:methyl-accepting chemotaxis protein n=1 Tax=Litoribacterium kuwaitense TaxID=1398745 RepID=UPI0013ED20DC|nr:methyl-accepting chemotaxis protein [Litoribacterium kuwaitense]NGP45583.1 HAMP domain-containing protein [Litoribacterium kuwaitense]